MKKITTITAVALLIMASFTSCKKESTLASTPTERKLAKVEQTGTASFTTNYTYNAQGRLSEYKNEAFTVKYDYSNSLISQITTNNTSGQKWERNTTSSVNEKTAVFETRAYNSNGALLYTEPVSYQYNTDGFLSGYSYGAYNYTHEIVNGNTTKTDGKNGIAFHSANIYEYYTDKINKLNLNWFEAQQQSQPVNDKDLFGKKNKNLFKKVTQVYVGFTFVYDFVYTLDSEGYVSTCTVTETKNGVLNGTYNYKFFYQ